MSTAKRPRGRPAKGASPVNIRKQLIFDAVTLLKLDALAEKWGLSRSAAVAKLVQEKID